MGLLSFETVLPHAPMTALPVRLEQSSPRMVAALHLSMLVPVALALITPFFILALHLVEDQASRSLMAERPGTMLQLGLALVVWSVLLGWPVKRVITRLSLKRRVDIDTTAVTVTDRGLFADKTWTAPLQTFTGLAHHIRASMSGVRHELILVHPDAMRSVLIAVAPRFSQTDVDAVCALLDRPEVPSKVLYRLRADRRLPTAAIALSSRGA
ncbi:MAG: hypothetical protein CTY20_14780 [Hyphomicrobium sp.]|nr:MAG: hypothetical protein CTY20_14780 [Hyphomicrobium sp.]